MALDADTVLWALRGLSSQGRGVSADDLARFLSNDATLSENYSRGDVSIVLEALVAAGDLSHSPTAGACALDGNEPAPAKVLYRLGCPESPIPSADAAVSGCANDDGCDPWRSHAGSHEMHDLFAEAFAEYANTGVAGQPPTAGDKGETDAYVDSRVDALERERDALIAERDRWRQRAESAEAEISCTQSESEELRVRIRELKRLLELQRSLEFERSERTRRTAVAFASARHELERLEQSIASGRARPQATRPRSTPRGNWLH